MNGRNTLLHWYRKIKTGELGLGIDYVNYSLDGNEKIFVLYNND